MAYSMEMVIDALRRMDVFITENKELLSDLDEASGDGDHGINMERCVSRLAERLTCDCADMGPFFSAVALNSMDLIGGSAGPLYGVFFMKLSKHLNGMTSAPLEEFAASMSEGLDALKRVGKSKVGDKTMVDTLEPAIAALNAHLPEGDAAAWNAALDAAERGMYSTEQLQARRGRGVVMGEATIGRRDAGATSAYYMIKALRDAAVGAP